MAFALPSFRFALSSFIGGGVVAGMYTSFSASASDATAHPVPMPWNHGGSFSSFDTSSLRRGFEVYRQICSTCHSLQFVAYRHLVGVTHTEEQAKALARSIEVTDGPNESGDMFQRPGKLFDRLPRPYANEEQGRFANGGAYPPDLTLMALARHGAEDYIFALLTGYSDAPAGVAVREGSYWNNYFPGNEIAMPKPLNDGQLEFEDGTPATVSQMAKDVSAFLTWSACPEQDIRKLIGFKLCCAFAVGCGLFGYYKRFRFMPFLARRITYARSFSGHQSFKY